MLSVALTGGIGSGKTAVGDIFYQLGKDKGLKLLDADQIARSLLQGSLNDSPSQSLIQVRDLFGADIFHSGKLDRTRLRALIFNSPKQKKQLESILHPQVYRTILQQLNRYRQQPDIKIIITAIPLFFETISETGQLQFDRILVVDVPESIQIQRSMHRDQSTRGLIQQIINSQTDRNTRLTRADDIIDNSGDTKYLKSQVKKLYNFYRTLS